MKIVLLQDVKNLGKKGDIKNISEGYARNFLLPKKLGVIATQEVVQKVEVEKKEQLKLEREALEKSRELAKNLSNLRIKLTVKEKNGKLFGSITTKNIADELRNHNFDIQEKCIKLEEAVKKIGDYKIKIDLGNKIFTDIILQVTGVK